MQVYQKRQHERVGLKSVAGYAQGHKDIHRITRIYTGSQGYAQGHNKGGKKREGRGKKKKKSHYQSLRVVFVYVI